MVDRANSRKTKEREGGSNTPSLSFGYYAMVIKPGWSGFLAAYAEIRVRRRDPK